MIKRFYERPKEKVKVKPAQEAIKKLRQLESIVRSIYLEVCKEYDELFPHPDGYETYVTYPKFKTAHIQTNDPTSNAALIPKYYENGKSLVGIHALKMFRDLHPNEQENPFPAFLFTYLHELGHDFLHTQGQDASNKRDRSRLRLDERFCDEFSGIMARLLSDKYYELYGVPLLSSKDLSFVENHLLMIGSDVIEYDDGWEVNFKLSENTNKSTHPVGATRVNSFNRGFETGNLRIVLEELGYIYNGGKV